MHRVAYADVWRCIGRSARLLMLLAGVGLSGACAGQGLSLPETETLAPIVPVLPSVVPAGVAKDGMYSLGNDAPADGLRHSEDTATDEEQGLASWYGARFHRRRTASGEPFDMYALTAAHPTLPFGTRVCVRSLVTGRSVQVRINDRGPHSGGRIIDLSRAAAKELGMLGLGTKPVAVSALQPEDDDGCASSSP